jgi:sulfopyruvate decarboxylase alpha subunit
MNGPSENWPSAIFDAFKKLGIQQVAYVPDAGHTQLIRACHADNDIRAVPLTTEEEGIGVLSGAWLGGQRGALLMQSSGSGNCVNALSLVQTCRFPLLTLVTMRGQWGETNPWQNPMGQATAGAFELHDVAVFPVDQADEVGETVLAAGGIAFNGQSGAAVLISQRLIGVKEFEGNAS